VGSLPWLLRRAEGNEKMITWMGFFVFLCLMTLSSPYLHPFRYISILPAIPVTLYLNPQEALEVRHPQEANRYHPFLSSSGGKLNAEAQPDQTSSRLQGHRDVTLYK